MAPAAGSHLPPFRPTPAGDRILPTVFPAVISQRRPVTVRQIGHITVVEVRGSLAAGLDELRQIMLVALAGEPHALVCDLSAASDTTEPDSLDVVAGFGSYPRDWPAVRVVVVSSDDGVRAGLLVHPVGRHMAVCSSLAGALAVLPPKQRPAVSRLRLAPHPTAGRAARIFVSRSCLDWTMTQGLAGACLVAGELVTNSIVRTRTDIEVSVSRYQRLMRICVRDHDIPLTPADDPEGDRLRRRYVLVEGFSRAWGMLPAAGGGRLVWAVIDG